ncbi:MAG TPA: NHL repeat-containing protein [Edaphobacter sp.]|nr:NHL repeat-containing protein [Edaphobacter sp.]
MAATLAISQTSTNNAKVCYQTPPTTKALRSPEGIAFDAKGNLWIADADSHRVLEYTPPFSTGMAATMELGQPAATAFTSGSSDGPSATSLAAPVALTFDPSGNLWVADYGFNRVLKYAPPFTNGMAAESVLGQADFTHGDENQGRTGPAADTLSGPWGLAFDSGGNLNVTERGNSRVLLFAPLLSNGMSASAVIGQTDFSAGAQNRGSDSPTANSLGQLFSLSAF